MQRVGVIDIGSNSVLGLVAERESAGPWRRVWEECEVTGLGQGLVEGEDLRPEAMGRTLDAVRHLNRGATVHGAEPIIVVGTMALRMAANAETLLAALRGSGISARVLRGEEEARYGWLSVSRDPLFGPDVTVLDVGGQSTEIASEHSRTSYPIGALRVVSEWLGSGPCEEEQILRASSGVDEILGSASPRGPVDASMSVVTIGATGVNLACMFLGLTHFDPDAAHGATLDYRFVGNAAGALARMLVEERDAIPSMEPKRAASIHGGALIMERAMHLLKVETLRVSSRGLRWGILEEIAPTE